MTRKQAISFLVVGIVLLLTLLFFLSVFVSPLLALAVVLAVLLILGLLLRAKPELFAALRAPAREDPFAALRAGEERAAVQGFSPRVILVSIDGGADEQIVVDKPEFTLGRGSACNYVFRASCVEISRIHAIIRYDARSGESSVADCRSQNGTFLNGERLAPDVPRPLSGGDVLQIGTLRFTVQSAHY